MPVAYASLSSALLGGTDFLAGLFGRRNSHPGAAMSMAVVAACTGVIVAGLYVLAFPAEAFGLDDLAWSAGAGVFAAFARPLLYLGMERGPMVVFAPVMGVVGIVVPAAAAPLVGQTPGALEAAGLLAAAPAVVLIVSEGRTPSWRLLRSNGVFPLAVLVGCLLGVSSVCMGQVDEGAGAMPALVLAVTASAITPGFVHAVSDPAPFTLGVVRNGAVLGSVEAVAVILFAAAYQIGNVAVVSAVLGFAPAVAIVLAVVLLSERMYRSQLIGGLLAGLAVVAFAAA